MIESLLIGLIIGVAAFTQSITGFGFALVAVSLLPAILGIRQTVALVALVSMLSNLILWLNYRESFRLGTVTRLLIGSIAGIPGGIFLLHYIPELVALKGLGLLLVSYSIYEWLAPALPHVTATHWAYVFGGVSGLLTGAYNTGGPPVVIYGNCNRWTMQTFKGNLSGFFLINSLVVAIAHSLRGSYTPELWRLFLWSLPAFAIGLLTGLFWSKSMKPKTFRQIVLLVLMLSGVRLLFSA